MISRISIGSALIWFSFLFIVSCQPQGRTEDIRKVDSLQQRLQAAEENFVIDMGSIRKRTDSMNQKYTYIQRNYDDSIGLELQTLLTSYRGLFKRYSQFLSRMQLLEAENITLKERIGNLKKDLTEGNIAEEDFETYYEKEAAIVNEHVEDVRINVKNIFQIEKQYQRDNEKVTALYEELGGNYEDPPDS
ncbi:MAG: hypothetical protein WD077_09505 [Bacteroidia bacterium]